MIKYRIVTGLMVPENAKEERRLVAARDKGEPIPGEERKMTRLEPGELVEWLPETSLPWLLEQGKVEEVGSDD